ncbi:chemotaxis protein CheW [Labrys monachus]|uniref:Chemotaxis protein CheW n=1 Tax=Labrys monachus TaxID=217067 RepID=A0ABU0FMK5_9HYPH|nr:chemotaxis protein CheW [Labrys monachus]MDQ0395736.1 chemotaxis-related protein WspD [Labrys monachus]
MASSAQGERRESSPAHPGAGQNGEAAAQTARNLLDRPLPPGYREEWAKHFGRSERSAEEREAAWEKAGTVMVFRLGEEWLALPTDIFHDVVEPRPIHSLPHRRDAVVLGLVNIRGELLVCVSLHELLHVGQDGAAPRTGRGDGMRRLVVIGRKDRRLVFAADEVHGVHRYDRSAVQAVPATIGLAASAFTTSMLAWQERTIGCLDGAMVLEMLDRSLA